MAAQAANVERQPLADLLRGKYPLDPTGQHPAVRVMQTGQPQWAAEMDQGCIAAATRDAEHRRVTEALGFRSYISVPLAARGRTLGALTLIATTDSGRRYGPHDVALADDLARRAALALDNARLYQQTEIQKALLSSQAEAGMSLMPAWARRMAGFDSSAVARRFMHQPMLRTHARMLRWAFGTPDYKRLAEERAAGAGLQAAAA